MDFLTDSSIWYLISFLIFIGIAWKMGSSAITKMLDDRIELIRQEIETAESLRVEAQELLAQYQRKYRDTEKDAETIIEDAKQNAEAVRQKALEDLDKQIKRSEEQHKERLELMKREAIEEIKNTAARLAVDGTRKLITEQLDEKGRENLMARSIQNIDSSLHS